MSFRITPQDVGRKVILRNGNIGTVIAYEDGDTPVHIKDVGGIGHYHQDGTCEFDMKGDDAIAFLDEYTQVRPKDLRDEFAMSYVSGILSHPNTISLTPIPAVCRRAYEFADAMMKARGK